MSKYKKGDKFVIVISEVMESNNGTLYRSNFSTLVFDDYGLDHLPQLVDGVNEACYNKGLEDAWEAAKKILYDEELNSGELIELFNRLSLHGIVVDYTPQEVIAKIKEWEDSKELKRGDEVTHKDVTGVVISDDIEYKVLWNNGEVGHSTKQCCPYVKTGRNFADRLDALLQEIGGDTNGKD